MAQCGSAGKAATWEVRPHQTRGPGSPGDPGEGRVLLMAEYVMAQLLAQAADFLVTKRGR